MSIFIPVPPTRKLRTEYVCSIPGFTPQVERAGFPPTLLLQGAADVLNTLCGSKEFLPPL